jgi:hypothetical protein
LQPTTWALAASSTTHFIDKVPPLTFAATGAAFHVGHITGGATVTNLWASNDTIAVFRQHGPWIVVVGRKPMSFWTRWYRVWKIILANNDRVGVLFHGWCQKHGGTERINARRHIVGETGIHRQRHTPNLTFVRIQPTTPALADNGGKKNIVFDERQTPCGVPLHF